MIRPLHRPLARLGALLVAAGLAGCGGGGDGDGFPSDIVFDVAAAYARLLDADAGYALAGTGSDGNRYTLDVRLVPAGSGAYPLTGQLGARGLVVTTLARNGVSLGTSQTTQFFDPSVPLLIGVASDDGSCATVTAQAALPREARVGSAGALYSATTFDRCDGAGVADGSVTASWSIETEAGVPLFCVTAEQRDAFGDAVATEQDCVEIDSLGRLQALARVTVVLPGSFSLVTRNY